MEHDDIKQLFADFKPQLSSDADFLSRLERNVNAVESIKAESKSLRRRFSLAVGLAAIFGLTAGFFLHALMPTIIAWLSNLDIRLGINNVTQDSAMLQLTVIGFISMLVSLVTYKLSQSLISVRRN